MSPTCHWLLLPVTLTSVGAWTDVPSVLPNKWSTPSTRTVVKELHGELGQRYERSQLVPVTAAPLASGAAPMLNRPS